MINKQQAFDELLKEYKTIAKIKYKLRRIKSLEEKEDSNLMFLKTLEVVEGDKLFFGIVNKEKITIKDLYKEYQELLYMEETDRIDIITAVALSTKLDGIPLWLIIVGPSGDMKSVQINSLENWPEAYTLHNLTSKTLVNGYPDKDKHPDLAPKLRDKLMIIPDMAQILKLPPVEKAEIWGQLRDLYDGYAGKCSGQGTDIKYRDIKVTLIAGSTPAIDSQILVHQDLGTRELIYRTTGTVEKKRVMEKCMTNEDHEREIKERLKEITELYLTQRKVEKITLSEELLEFVQSCALYICTMRATADFDHYTQELRSEVWPEEPTRIVKQLKRLAVCLMNLEDDYDERKAMKILKHVAESCAFPLRARIFDFLLQNLDKGEFSTSQMSEILKLGKGTIKRECAIFEYLDIVNCRRRETSFPDRFYEYWSLNNEHEFVLNYQTVNTYHTDYFSFLNSIYICIICVDGFDIIIQKNQNLQNLTVQPGQRLDFEDFGDFYKETIMNLIHEKKVKPVLCVEGREVDLV